MKFQSLIIGMLGISAAFAQVEPADTKPLRLTGLNQQDFLQFLVQRSVEVQYSQLNKEVTQHLMQGEAGLYETTFFAGIRKEERLRQRTASETGSFDLARGTSVLEEGGRTNELGFRNKLPWGSEVSLSYKVAQKDNNLIPLYNNGKFDTEYNTQLSITLKQPLLRNAGRGITETDRRVAELEHQVSLQQLQQQTLKTSIDGLSLYWQLYRAEATLSLRENAYTTTQELLEDTQARIDAGKLPASAKLELQGVLLSRKAEVTRSQQALREAQGKLATALNLTWSENTALSTQPLLQPMDTAPPLAPKEQEPVLLQWPPYQIAQLKFQQALTRLNFAANQQLPQFDLLMSYSGTGYDYLPESARITAVKAHYPDWYVGLNYEIPLLGNQKAQQQFLAQSKRLTQAELEIIAIKNSFFNDLTVRYSDLEQSHTVLLASQEETQLRQTMLDNERIRHEHGLGLLGTLLQKQSDLIEAQQRLLENRIRYEVALATWQYTQGSLLQMHQIHITPEPTPTP